ncbi:hypothetical protein BH09VER1_BH09VER1_17990 [soil metagenome]
MKSSRGFTLIELLIVIAIIGILMALLFPAVQGAIDSARRAQAKNDVTQIATAINAYVTEYGKMPMTSISGDTTVMLSTNGDAVLAALMGVNTNLNPRALVFLEVNDAKKGKSGITNGTFVDPWGGAYYVTLDGDYDNKITVPGAGSNTAIRKTVGVCNTNAWNDGSPTNKWGRRVVNSWD